MWAITSIPLLFPFLRPSHSLTVYLTLVKGKCLLFFQEFSHFSGFFAHSVSPSRMPFKQSIYVLGWLKSLFGFFCNILWKSWMNIFGQPQHISLFSFLQILFKSCLPHKTSSWSPQTEETPLSRAHYGLLTHPCLWMAFIIYALDWRITCIWVITPSPTHMHLISLQGRTLFCMSSHNPFGNYHTCLNWKRY